MSEISSSSLRLLHCKFCKSISPVLVQGYSLDNFSVLTCTNCLHSRIRTDPAPIQVSPYVRFKREQGCFRKDSIIGGETNQSSKTIATSECQADTDSKS